MNFYSHVFTTLIIKYLFFPQGVAAVPALAQLTPRLVSLPSLPLLSPGH
jgi:hypothetical protein